MVQNGANILVQDIDANAAKTEIIDGLRGAVFCIGHADTARIAAKSLNAAICIGRDIDWVEFTEEQMFHRANITLSAGDVLYVLQVMGGRLPEGCTELPEGIQLQWRKVTVL
jgi:hypothetical protein